MNTLLGSCDFFVEYSYFTLAKAKSQGEPEHGQSSPRTQTRGEENKRNLCPFLHHSYILPCSLNLNYDQDTSAKESQTRRKQQRPLKLQNAAQRGQSKDQLQGKPRVGQQTLPGKDACAFPWQCLFIV